MNILQQQIYAFLNEFKYLPLNDQTKEDIESALTGFVKAKIMRGEIKPIDFIVDINYRRRLPHVWACLSNRLLSAIERYHALMEYNLMLEDLKVESCLRVAILHPVTLDAYTYGDIEGSQWS